MDFMYTHFEAANFSSFNSPSLKPLHELCGASCSMTRRHTKTMFCRSLVPMFSSGIQWDTRGHSWICWDMMLVGGFNPSEKCMVCHCGSSDRHPR